MSETATFTDQFSKAFSDAVDKHSGEEESSAAAETTEQETGESEATEETSESTQKAGDQIEETADSQLLPKEEVDKLPEELKVRYKDMNRAFTKKTQALAAERKSIAAQKDFLTSWREDPIGTVREAARQLGLEVAEPKTTDKSDTKTETIDVLKDFQVPEQLKFMEPLFQPLIQEVRNLRQQVAGLKEPVERTTRAHVDQQIKATLAEFDTKHPDWKNHESKMAELSKKFQPGEEVSDLEWMEHLYTLATAGQKDTESVKKVLKQIEKSSKAAQSSQAGVQSEKVASKAPQFKNFSEAFDKAFEAAKQGVRWE